MPDTQLKLRVPLEMREAIRRRAVANRRSMNAEIVHYLDRALAAGENESPATAPTVPGSDQNPQGANFRSNDERE